MEVNLEAFQVAFVNAVARRRLFSFVRTVRERSC